MKFFRKLLEIKKIFYYQMLISKNNDGVELLKRAILQEGNRRSICCVDLSQ